ncbi:MAG: D-tyrosyl-tRNA(Tyr) deacylase [Patiriisocius sp.]|jgi:D-tyrosyl-tRNA(Tyr) deacylase
MKAVLQRVSEASVKVDGEIISKIENGFLVLLGVADNDEKEDADWLINKIINLRVFSDSNGMMNKSVLDIDGEVLVISQFTLFARVKKGNRPSFIAAAKPEKAIPMYEDFIVQISEALGKKAGAGKFGADMKVALINDGPVTISIDTKNKE